MTGPQMLAVVAQYQEFLKNRGARVQPIETNHRYSINTVGPHAVADHLMWMIYRIENMASTNDQKSWEKANRWLGFIQGCLYMLGCFSIDEMRDQTREGP